MLEGNLLSDALTQPCEDPLVVTCLGPTLVIVIRRQVPIASSCVLIREYRVGNTSIQQQMGGAMRGYQGSLRAYYGVAS